MANDNQIAIELTAIDNATGVLDKVRGATETLGGAFTKLQGVLAGLGVAFSAGAFVSMIEGSISSMNALYELSLRTGAAVETLSALRGVAKQSGTDMDAVAGIVQKLSKNMFEFGESGTGKAAKGFEALGYTQAQVKVGLQSMDTFLPEFAKRLTETGTGSQQVAVAMELMGKAGGNALPFLHQLAEQGELHGKVTAEQARQAHEFEVTMAKLSSTSTALKNSIAADLLPALLSIANAFLEIKKASGSDGGTGGGFWKEIGEGLRFVADRALAAWSAITIFAKAVAMYSAAVDQAKTGNFRGAAAVIDAYNEDVQKSTQSYMDMKAKLYAPPTAASGKTGGAPLSIGGAAAAGGGNDSQRLLDMDRANLIKSLEVQESEYKEYNATVIRMDEDRARDAQRLLDQDLANYIRSLEAKMAEDDRVQTAIAEAQTKTNKTTKEAAGYMKDLGFAMISSAENAISHWQGFRNLLQGVLADLAKVALRKGVTDPLSSAAGNWLSGVFGSRGTVNGASITGVDAFGGPMSAGESHLVGENGPEVFTAGTSGTITPNAGAKSTGDVYINFNGGPPVDPQTFLAQVVPVMRSIARGEIGNQLRPGGVLA